MITKEILIAMEPGKRFATGTGTYPEIYNKEIRWVACRGIGYHDWCVYYHLVDTPLIEIQQHGDKMFTENVIKRLVPCDEEAWNLYRF